MSNDLYNRTIAFAGMCQAAALVQELAKSGHYDTNAFGTSLNAIVKTNPSSTLDVFGDEVDLKIGLDTLANKLDSSPNGSELTRYLIGIIALATKLTQRKDSLSQLGDRIQMIERQLDHYDINDESMLSNIASIYLDVISPIGPRIQISGTPAVLQLPINQHKVRILLLSAIRCAVLWRQVGGRRTHLIFSRKKMIEQAKIILARN
ncbi:high frequency lysogenization protein HflD [Vibrio sp.]|nr:high frequency lysogenization protein HflD [Vibrio sp.]